MRTTTSVELDELGEMLEQWRRVRPETDVDAMALVPRIMRLAYLLDQELQAINASFGLERGWLDVLSALRRTGPPHRLPATQLARSVLLSSGGMTARLDRMEEAGLVRRLADPNDRRGVLVDLTPKGRTTIDRAIDAHTASYGELVNTPTPNEHKRIAEWLRRQLLRLERRRGA